MAWEIVVQVGTDVAVSLGLHGASALFKRSKPVITRLLRLRFAGPDPATYAPDVETAVERLRTFGAALDSRVARLEETGALTDSRLERLFAQPEVTGALYSALEAAIESGDEDKREILAELVADRLSAEDDLEAISTRLAIESVRNVTGEQLRGLAFLYVLQVNPDSENISDYRDWLSTFVGPLIDVPIDDVTISHLCAIGLLDYDFASLRIEDAGTPPVLIPAASHFPNAMGDDLSVRINGRATGDRREGIEPLGNVSLRPAGAALASAALKEFVGLNLS